MSFQFMLALVMFVVSLYPLVRLILPLPANPFLKACLALFLLLGTQKVLIMDTLLGPMSTLTMHGQTWLLIITGAIENFVVILFLLTLVCDILLLIVKGPLLIWKKLSKAECIENAESRRRNKVKNVIQFCVVATVAIVLSVWGTWEAVKVPSVREVSISVPKLPTELSGLRLAQLSDLHIGPLFDRQWLNKVVDQTNALNPDLIAITGDLIDGNPALVKPDIEPLTRLKAKYGIWIITGNHEYYSGYQAWMRIFRSMNFHVLENEWQESGIATENTSIILAGVTDVVATRFGSLYALPDPEGVLRDIRQTKPESLTIMLAHNPSLAWRSAEAGAALQLSGHTHGGQILPCSPLIAKANKGFVSGKYEVKGMPLYVSSGTGLWAGFPLRLFVPSEITLIRFTAGNRR